MCSADFSSCATSPCFLSSAHSPFQPSSLPVLTCPKCFVVFFFLAYWNFCPSLFPAFNPLASCTHSPRKPQLFIPTPALLSCFASPLHSHFPVLSCLPLQSFYWWPTSPPLCSSLETLAHLTQIEIKIYKNRRLGGGGGVQDKTHALSHPAHFHWHQLLQTRVLKSPWWTALGFKLLQQEHLTVIPNSYRSFCV